MSESPFGNAADECNRQHVIDFINREASFNIGGVNMDIIEILAGGWTIELTKGSVRLTKNIEER